MRPTFWTINEDGPVTTVSVIDERVPTLGVRELETTPWAFHICTATGKDGDERLVMTIAGISILDPKTLRLRSHPLQSPVRCVCVTPTGRLFACAHDEFAELNLAAFGQTHGISLERTDNGNPFAADMIHTLDMVATSDNRIYCADQQRILSIDLITHQTSVVAHKAPVEQSTANMAAHPTLANPWTIALDPTAHDPNSVFYVGGARQIHKLIVSGVVADLEKTLPIEHLPVVLWHIVAEYAVRRASLELIQTEQALSPLSMAVVPCGMLLVSCGRTDSIWAVEPETGQVFPVAGRLYEPPAPAKSERRIDGPPLTARFAHPSCMALVISEQAIYVADTGNCRIRRVPISPLFFIPKQSSRF